MGISKIPNWSSSCRSFPEIRFRKPRGGDEGFYGIPGLRKRIKPSGKAVVGVDGEGETRFRN
jgi:hypothetical protein